MRATLARKNGGQKNLKCGILKPKREHREVVTCQLSKSHEGCS